MTIGKHLAKSEIIKSPEYCLSVQAKSLEERLDDVKLTAEEETKIAAEHTGKIIKDKVLGLFKIGDLVSTLLKWNEEVNDDIRKAKKEYLLSAYLDKSEKMEDAVNALKSFLTNPQGNTLFNKILRIFDDSPPDEELAEHLSTALHYIVNSRFEVLFDEHKYALAQIEQLTPHALTILADNKNWPLIPLGSYSSSGRKITSDWLPQFKIAYADSKGIIDKTDLVERIGHSINELMSRRLIEAHMIKKGTAKCITNSIGDSLLPYIQN